MNSLRTSLAACVTTLSLMSMLGGCANVDQKIGLNYARQNDSIVKHTGDVAVSYVDPAGLTKNALGEWIIGSLNNVYGVHQADLLSDRSPGEWISQALLHELRQAGYSAIQVSILPASAERGILVTDINLLFLVNKGTVSTETKHELRFSVSLYRNGMKAKTFTVATRDDRTIPMIASKEDKEKIMLQSLQDAMKQIIPDLIVLIDKK